MPTTGATRTKKKPARDVAAPGSDLVYGLLSILDQFGGVLRERGREYRRSQSGGPLRGGMREIYESLGQGEQDMLRVIASALDGLSAVVNDLQRSLATNGNGQHAGRGDNGNDGIHANGRRPTSARRSRNGTDEP